MGGDCRHWLEFRPDLLSLARSWPREFPFLLESAVTVPAGAGAALAASPQGRHSILMLAGDEELVAQPNDAGRSDFFERLNQWFQSERISGPEKEGDVPFRGGWFLFLGYEMAAAVEPTLTLPPNPTRFPDALARRCRGAIIVFHGRAQRPAVAVAEEPEALQLLLQRLAEARALDPSADAAAAGSARVADIVEGDPHRFESQVRRIHEYLRAGDVFQVNISRPWQARIEGPADPCRLYAALRRNNPAPYAGLVRWRDLCLLSSSPERLIGVRGRLVQTRPIAGTRPRGNDALRDQALSRELIGDPKERAEHIMLIDLERNDLGRVCEPGSVEVSELMAIESFAHVHHIVSNVRGRLRADAGPCDAIRAVFPGGTITGCPKVRCMEIIAELEGEGRGFYTGSMGYLNRDGDLDLNILIRTMLLDGDRITFRTGAGIVADSDPERELAETADKARGLLLAITDTL